MQSNENPGGVTRPASPEEPHDGEPRTVDPDSDKRLAEELPQPAHGASRFDAGTGQGTVSGPPHDGLFQERPILDGSTQGPLTEATVPNPSRGQADPAGIIRQPALNSTHSTRWLASSLVAVVILTVVMLLLLQWSPLWCGLGIAFILLATLAMLIVRASSMSRRMRLRLEAVLHWLIWLVPLVIIISVLIGHRDDIW